MWIKLPSLEEVFGFGGRWLGLRLSLLDNAKDSIRHGLQHYLEPNPTVSDFKQAVINIHLGFELALKEALRRQHEAFILSSFGVEMLKSLIKGEQLLERSDLTDRIRTISFEETVTRAKEVLGLNAERATFLLGLNRLRRATVHYSFQLDQRGLEGLLGAHLKPALEVTFCELLGEDLSFLPAGSIDTLQEIQKRTTDPIALNLHRRIGRARDFWSGLTEVEREKKVTSALGLRRRNAEFQSCPSCGQRSLERHTETKVIDHDPEGRPMETTFTVRASCACCPFEIEGDEAIYYCDWGGLADE